MKFSPFLNRFSLLWGILGVLFLPTGVIAQTLQEQHLSDLKFRHLGPVGNRIVSVAGVPGDPMVYYVGAASGGIWKTTDAGLTWKPVFDDKPVHAIGAMALAPSDPEVVWAGTGEPFIRSNVSIGDGVWKSTDGGTTWNNMGLQHTGRISRMIVHPQNPDIVYAAALGHGYLPQKDRGVFRTMDGGKTWEHVLMVNDSTGASDLVMDPNNPRILFAGMWQLDIKTWKRTSGGKGSGIFMSKDGGDTWERLQGKGLPKGPIGKIALAMSKADSKRIYALIETGDGVPMEGQPTDSGELWRSDDGGQNWQLVNYDRDLTGRGAYYTRCAASPDNPDEIYFMAAGFSLSKDGGQTVVATQGLATPNWDHHEMWIDPSDGARMLVVGDGGLAISQNRGKTWLRVQLPVAQLYHVTADNKIPYHVYANRQDGPSTKGPSRSRTEAFLGPAEISRGEWYDVGGGESGFATPDPVNPDIVWSSASGLGAGGGIVVRYNDLTKQFRQVEVWPEATFGSSAAEVKYRFQWTFPVLISPHDNNTVYVTSQHVHRTTNGGQTWELVSPDLSTNDKSKQGVSGGLTPDNIGVEYCCVIYALDESPVQQGVLWAGTNDGLVQISKNGGASWENVTANIPGLPPLGTVRNIDASKYSAGKAYLTVDFHEVGNFKPYVYKTEDFGKTWKKITRGIPESTLSYARNIREDPVRPGLLYLGTENALYVSLDDGENWQPFMLNLPSTPMYWITIQEHFNDMVLGTYGRGIWILDDLSAIQQLTPEVASQNIHLFDPHAAYRFRPVSQKFAMFNDPSAGQDPAYGAVIQYWLKADAEKPVEIVITDAQGNKVRTLTHTGKAGINRINWDLREDPSMEITLRTLPQHADWIDMGKERTRKVPSLWPNVSPLVPPGNYTVTLQSGEQSFSSALEVRKDPNSEGSLEDIQAQYALISEIKKDVNAVAEMINELEWMRRQLYDLRSVATGRQELKDITEAIDALDQTLLTIEGELTQSNLTGKGQDFIRYPAKLLGKLNYLASVAETADFQPADQHRQVHTELQERLKEVQQQYNAAMQNEVPAFVAKLQAKGLNSPLLISSRP